ncbi:transposase mutator type [Thermosulfidibacter takaii ABI70S6]|uniref:Mutator family transposase n=1 Tax=Thermosulfidibacter takaii (strain DSM 17441 / JCM 13301 / NBRC 103674 / ABI70S6) TaxID=1298851 RepID=A0A0S3QUK9_THET7|nr:transposase [Thermosulfidibacter takaii]BAT72003.1 transposase mutator type [Thermosulfidibacter takaii ABI70S6]
MPDKWKRQTKEGFVNLAYSILLSSRSIEAAKRSLRDMEVPLSESYLEEIISEVREYFDVLNSSFIEPDQFALVLDAKVVKVKVNTTVSNYTIYSAVGISLEGQKEVLGITVTDGNESLNGWRSFLKSLMDRGLRRVLIVVHDDFSGLSNLVRSLFPKADDQICTVHMLRNLKYRLSPKVYQKFKERFQTIKNAFSYELGSSLFEDACEMIAQYEGETARRLLQKKESYLAFLKYPAEVRSSISSTNIAECFNRRIEDAEQLSGGYFHSVKDLKLKLAIIVKGLHNGRWRKPTYKIASVSHILKAEFRNRFEK